MKIALILAVPLLFLSACADTGANRSYIISETHEKNAPVESSSENYR